MADSGRSRRTVAMALPATLMTIATLSLGGCGNTGELYLPNTGTSGDVVTRPAQTPPADPAGTADSPQSADSPPQPPSPAPEVTSPEPEKKKEETGKSPR